MSKLGHTTLYHLLYMLETYRVVIVYQAIYRVPHIVFRFVVSLLVEDQAVICIKCCLPAFSIGKQCEGHRGTAFNKLMYTIIATIDPDRV